MFNRAVRFGILIPRSESSDIHLKRERLWFKTRAPLLSNLALMLIAHLSCCWPQAKKKTTKCIRKCNRAWNVYSDTIKKKMLFTVTLHLPIAIFLEKRGTLQMKLFYVGCVNYFHCKGILNSMELNTKQCFNRVLIQAWTVCEIH